MLHLLKRHPIPISAFFRHSVVLTYAFPPEVLKPLLPAALVLDTWGGFAFLAVALVQTERLRPSFLPAALGSSFFLSGNELMESIHDRMPVIVAPKDYERWLAPADPARLPVDLLKPYPAEEMKAWKVSKAVGNTRNDGPSLIERC